MSGHQVTVNAGSPLVNIMTRDYVFDDVNSVAKKISSSSFTTVHGISVPLCYNVSGRYDDGFKNLK